MLVQRLIYQFLQYRRSHADDTSVLGSAGHNDVLCPAVQRRCEKIVDTLENYHHISYDIQGPRDEGVDVILRLKEGELYRYVLFQIKSEADIRQKEFLEKLRGQWFRAVDMYPDFDDYYILLCCAAEKNKARIRSTEGAFAKKERTHVIEPEFALTFLRLSTTQIDAHIKRELGRDDIVFRQALSAVADLTPTELSLLLQLIAYRLYTGKLTASMDALVQSLFLSIVYENTPDYDRTWFFIDLSDPDFSEEDLELHDEYKPRGWDTNERLSADIDYLEGEFTTRDRQGEIVLQEDRVRSLIVLMLDGELRYGYLDLSLLQYMLNLFGPMKGYEEPTETLSSQFQ